MSKCSICGNEIPFNHVKLCLWKNDKMILEACITHEGSDELKYFLESIINDKSNIITIPKVCSRCPKSHECYYIEHEVICGNFNPKFKELLRRNNDGNSIRE